MEVRLKVVPLIVVVFVSQFGGLIAEDANSTSTPAPVKTPPPPPATTPIPVSTEAEAANPTTTPGQASAPASTTNSMSPEQASASAPEFTANRTTPAPAQAQPSTATPASAESISRQSPTIVAETECFDVRLKAYIIDKNGNQTNGTEVVPKECAMPYLLTFDIKFGSTGILNFIIYRRETSWQILTMIQVVWSPVPVLRMLNSNATQAYRLDTQEFLFETESRLVIQDLFINPFKDTSSSWPTVIIWLLIMIIGGSAVAYYVVARR